mmetsp:Transcript_37050/g.66704  ORF Transcript_37050/g.66704 Transcript_37050/m.66704 type:complete len:354 (+) Transcript_37050:1241-2302(+)
MNFVIWTTNEVHIPTIRPGNIGLDPVHFIRVHNLHGIAGRSTTQGKVRLGLVHGGIPPGSTRVPPVLLVGRLEVRLQIDLLVAKMVRDTDGMDVESRDAHSLEFGGLLAVRDGKLEVVVEVKFVLLEAGVGGGSLETDGVTADCVIELLAAHQYGELVEGEVDAVLTIDELAEPAEFLSAHLHDAEGGARFANLGGEAVRCHLELVSHQTGAEVAALAESLLDLLTGFRADGQIVIFEGELGLFALHQFDEGGDGFAVAVFLGGSAGEEDLGQGGIPSFQNSLPLLFAEFIRAEFGRLLGHADLILPRGFHVGHFHGLLLRLDLLLFARNLFRGFAPNLLRGICDIVGGGEEG